MKVSDWPLSEKDRGLAGGMAHVCPVSEEDRMAAAKADLQKEIQVKVNACGLATDGKCRGENFLLFSSIFFSLSKSYSRWQQALQGVQASFSPTMLSSSSWGNPRHLQAGGICNPFRESWAYRRTFSQMDISGTPPGSNCSKPISKSVRLCFVNSLIFCCSVKIM